MSQLTPYPKRRPFDISKYEQPEAKLEAYYGLPKDIFYCKKCVYSSQYPVSAIETAHTIATKKKTLHFTDGLCDACRVNEQKHREINWEERERELQDLCDQHRSKDGSYDCIVPGSGGKDSVYAAHILKFKYKMNPLTVTWAPHMYTDWGWKNMQAWIHSGFDNYLHTPNGKMHRLITRLSVENIFHPFQPFIIGQKAFAPKMSILHKIPLVFFGENEAEYGNPIADFQKGQRDWSYFTESDKSKVFLGGTSVADLKEHYGVTDNDLLTYMPADPEAVRKNKTEVHFLGYYLKWHPQGSYYYAVQNCGFQPCPERNPGTYTKYAGLDDKIDDFHFYTTFIKFGMGRASYDAVQEVWNDEITREEAAALVKRFDGEFPERFAKEIYEFLSINPKEFPVASKMFEQPIMDHEYFMALADQFRSPHLWKRENGQWKLRNAVWYDQTTKQPPRETSAQPRA